MKSSAFEAVWPVHAVNGVERLEGNYSQVKSKA